MTDLLRERAPAKVNLTLHVLGRRHDGYHDLESLVAFAGCSDLLILTPSAHPSLTVSGPTATAAGGGHENLVWKALEAVRQRREGVRAGSLHLVKRLPVAAGLGGGSSDAAAALRLLARLNDWPLDDPLLMEVACLTGADVPVCMEPSARMMRGVGDVLGAALEIPPMFAVLVNPGVGVSTPAVFRALGYEPGCRFENHAHPSLERVQNDSLRAILQGAQNHLQPPAMGLEPAIETVCKALLSEAGCWLVRMSGSGATVFGLFDDCHQAAKAARNIAASHPGWWARPTLLR